MIMKVTNNVRILIMIMKDINKFSNKLDRKSFKIAKMP